MSAEVYSHDQLCLIAYKWLVKQGFKVCFHDKFRACVDTGEQPDVIGFKSGTSCLIEVKVSRSDFLADRNKKFRKNPEQGMGDWRFYFAPKGVLTVDDMPDGWFLIEWTGKRAMCKNFQFHNCIHHSPPNKGNKDCEVQLLTSALNRFRVRNMLDTVYKKIDE